MISRLGSTGSNDSEPVEEPKDHDDDGKAKDNLVRQRLLRQSYNFLGYSYWIAAVWHAVFAFQQPTAHSLPRVAGAIAGYLLAGTLCKTMLSTTVDSSSDTYHRLSSWGLGLFSLVQLPAIYKSPVVTTLFTLQRLVAVCTVLARRRWTPPPQPFTLSSAWQSWRVKNRYRALTYRNCSVLFVLGAFFTWNATSFEWRYRGSVTLGQWLVSTAQLWEGMGRQLLLATFAHVLKDAAERERLSGTTFMRLNLLVALWALAVAAGQAVNPVGFRSHQDVYLTALAGPFLLGAYRGLREKRLQNRLARAADKRPLS